MRIFISSVIGEYGHYRDAAVRAIELLGHEPIKAEDFGASYETPQIACLKGVRTADVVILLMGSRYGAIQDSGLSATHEEYEEARERRPVLVFIEEVSDREPEQNDFVNGVQSWSQGHYTARFNNADNLYEAIVKAVHELQLSTATGQVDQAEMQQRAIQACSNDEDSWGNSQLELTVSIVCGPAQSILRPTQLEDSQFRSDQQQMAMFGAVPVLDQHDSTKVSFNGDSLVLKQAKRAFSVSEDGTVVVKIKPSLPDDSLAAIIEEDIQDHIERSLSFANFVLEKIDPTNRATHVAVAVALSDADHYGWRTRAEHAAKPNTMTMNVFGTGSPKPVTLVPAHRVRSALRFNCSDLASDLLVKLRREVKNPDN